MSQSEIKSSCHVKGLSGGIWFETLWWEGGGGGGGWGLPGPSMELDWAPAAAGGRGTPVPLGPKSLECDNDQSGDIMPAWDLTTVGLL